MGILAVVAAPLLTLQQTVAAEPNASGPPSLYEQGAIALHTDVGKERATAELVRLANLQSRLENYWDRKLRGKLTCYWITDLARWPEGEIPREAREKLLQKSAVTLTERASLDDKVVSIKSIVYASHKTVDLHHEVVHAYCWQTFERCGPSWYAEGMAEVFANAAPQSKAVRYHPWAIEYLRERRTPPTPWEIVKDEMPEQPLWQTYAHRWALCCLLSNHPRYATKFQQYGQQLLRGREVDFLESFDDVRQALADDYRQFLRDVAPGYEFPAQSE